MNMEYLLLSIYNKPRLNFEEVCKCLNLEPSSGRTKRSEGTFPVPVNGRPLGADIRDVAQYLDKLREDATSNLRQTDLFVDLSPYRTTP